MTEVTAHQARGRKNTGNNVPCQEEFSDTIMKKEHSKQTPRVNGSSTLRYLELAGLPKP